MLVSDHIGLTGVSPLFGESGTERFVDMVDAYSPRLRERLRELAARLGIELREGVYVWFSGPQFETPPRSAPRGSSGARRSACRPCLR